MTVGVLSMAVLIYSRARLGWFVKSKCCARKYCTHNKVAGGSSFPSSVHTFYRSYLDYVDSVFIWDLVGLEGQIHENQAETQKHSPFSLNIRHLFRLDA